MSAEESSIALIEEAALPFSTEAAQRFVYDAVASKRVLKTGYVRQPGGLYPGQCDTVASHSHAVAALAAVIAYEVADLFEKACSIRLNLEQVLLLAVFHDHAETRSGDTGAQSIAIYGSCKLYDLESDALKAMLAGFRLAPNVTGLYEGYRTYTTAEALVVHAADIIEGFEKAASHFPPHSQPIQDAVRILGENVRIFRDRKHAVPTPEGEKLSKAGSLLVDRIVLPITSMIARSYRLDVEKDLALMGRESQQRVP